MYIIKIVFQIILILLFLFTGLQLIRRDEWWIRIADFPHVQITAISVTLFACMIPLTETDKWWDLMILATAGVLIVYQVRIIWPYTKLATKQSKDWTEEDAKQTISILEANVLMYNEEYPKLLGLIKDHRPDVVIGLETDHKWKDALVSLEETYPYTILYPLDNTYGMLLYSKLKIKDSKVKFLIEKDVPSIEADIELGNEKIIRLYVVHPEPPSPTENERSTERDAELIVVGKKIKECYWPVIVAGDLNDVAWSHTTRLFQRLSGLLDPRIGRGFFNTFHAQYPLLRWPLDHVFHSKHFLVKRIQRLPSIGSDHFPMLIELSLEPTNGHIVNDRPNPVDKEDVEESKEKIAKVNRGQN